MDLLNGNSELDLFDAKTKIYAKSLTLPPHYISQTAEVSNCFIADGCQIHGRVEHSILFPGVYVGKDALIKDSVIMPAVKIGDGCIIQKSIVSENTHIGDFSSIGILDPSEYGSVEHEITVLGENLVIPADTQIIDGNIINYSIEDKEAGKIS